MAIVLVETKGDASANAYMTVAEADTFFEQMYGYEEWFILDAETKAKLLITASNIIDNMPIKFPKVSETQSLSFPIVILDNIDDGFVSAKKATAYQAWHIFQNGDAINEAKTKAIQGVTSESIKGNGQTIKGFNFLRSYSSEALKVLSKYTDFSMKLSPRY